MVNKKGIFLTAITLIFLFLFLPVSNANAQSSVSGERISGRDRYETCINISKAGWPVSSTSGVAVIATGKDFPDALSAAPLAKKYDAPILLTGSNTLDTTLSSELTRLMIKKVFIVGGPGVIPQEIENKLKSMGIECIRLFGNDRYETSAAVANAIGSSSRVVIATGEDFPDALSIASWAASNGAPILLTQPDKLPLSIEDYIKKYSINSCYVIGGTGVVNDTVLSKLPNAQRIYGQDRFATNVAVLNTFNSQFDFNKMYLATGNDFPDALSGSALAAMTKSPIILTNTGSLPSTKTYIDSNISRINQVYILGGEGVVTNGAVEGVIPPVVTKVDVTISSPGVAVNKQIKASANVAMIPSNAAKPGVTYTIGDPSIAKIDPDGTITGLKVGNTRVTASVGGKTSSINVLVKLDKLIVLDPGHGGTSTGAVPTGEDGTKLIDYREAVLNMQIVQKIKYRLEALGARVVLTRNGDNVVSLEDRAKIANDLNADWFISIHHNSAANTSANGTSAYYSSYKPGASTGTLYVYATYSGPVYDLNGNAIGNLAAGGKYTYIDTFLDTKGIEYVRFNFNGVTAKVATGADYICIRDGRISSVVEDSKEISTRINNAISSLGLVKHGPGVYENDFAVNRLTNMPSTLVEVAFLSNITEFRKISQDSFQNLVADKVVQALKEFYEINPGK